jgi:chemotaxis protein CheD
VTTFSGTQEKTSILVGLGEVKVSQDPESILTCLGLGSCIALCAYDGVAHIGGMAHIVLPDSDGNPERQLSKFADVAIEVLLAGMQSAGANVRGLTMKMSGGAEMSIAPGLGTIFKTGERNIQATIDLLADRGMKLSGWDIGGDRGRSVRLDVSTGKVVVATAGGAGKQI